jgi:hypothetical protein
MAPSSNKYVHRPLPFSASVTNKFAISEGAQHSAKEGKMALSEAKKILGLGGEYKVADVTEVRFLIIRAIFLRYF